VPPISLPRPCLFSLWPLAPVGTNTGSEWRSMQRLLLGKKITSIFAHTRAPPPAPPPRPPGAQCVPPSSNPRLGARNILSLQKTTSLTWENGNSPSLGSGIENVGGSRMPPGIGRAAFFRKCRPPAFFLAVKKWGSPIEAGPREAQVSQAARAPPRRPFSPPEPLY